MVGPVADIELLATPDGGLIACDFSELVVVDSSLAVTSRRDVDLCPTHVSADGSLYTIPDQIKTADSAITKETLVGGALWTLPLPANLYLTSSAVDQTGDVYALVDSTDAQFVGESFPSGMYVIKLDPQGQFVWSHAAPPGAEIIAASDGGVVVLGERPYGTMGSLMVEGTSVDSPAYLSTMSPDGAPVAVRGLGAVDNYVDDLEVVADLDGFVTILAQSNTTSSSAIIERWSWSAASVWSHPYQSGIPLDFVADGHGAVSIGVIGGQFDGQSASDAFDMVVGSYDASGALTRFDHIGSAKDAIPTGDVPPAPAVWIAPLTGGLVVVPMHPSPDFGPATVFPDVALGAFP